MSITRVRRRMSTMSLRDHFSDRERGLEKLLWGAAQTTVEALEPRLLMSGDSLIMTEFLSANDSTIDDEDGDSSDYIEVHNPTSNTINLDGWHLTDNSTNLDKWSFPDMDLGAGEYLVVFASNKDRDRAGEELHTNFRLGSSGEYLALTHDEPDEINPFLLVPTVVQEFSPSFPPQLTDVSYGVPTETTETVFVEVGDAADVLVPTNGNLELDWTENGFVPGAGWQNLPTGIGFEEETGPVGGVIADSISDWSTTGTQGENGWSYGLFNATTDDNGIFESDEFSAFDPSVYNNFFWLFQQSGTSSRILIRDEAVLASDNVGGDELWAVKRWESDFSGTASVVMSLAKSQTGGDGVTGRIYHNGVEILSETIGGTDTTGVEVPVLIENLQVGDTVDLVFLTQGISGNSDVLDGSLISAEIVAGTVVAPEKIADSVEDWSDAGIQGENNWTYGYYDRTADGNSTYAADEFQAFPRDGGGHSNQDFWDGNQYDWFNGNPPWTMIGREGIHPNGVNNAVEHWAIRRYESEVSGTLDVEFHLRKANSAGSGVTGKVFHNGVEVFTRVVGGGDTVGFTEEISIEGVVAGDFIDFVQTPIGIGGNTSDGSDGSAMAAKVFAFPKLGPSIASDISSEMHEVGSSAYLRLPFDVADPSSLDTLNLQMQYDAGFAAFLNGVAILNVNAPGEDDLSFDSTATTERSNSAATTFANFNISEWLGLLQAGTNVLAIQGLNSSASDSDFLITPRLVGAELTVDLNAARYFTLPTPGEQNGAGTTSLGPIVANNAHSPQEPLENENLVVTAQVVETFNPLESVKMFYRVHFGAEVEVDMVDDGTGSDAVAGDGIYTGVIPSSAYSTGQMVRWRFVTRDDQSNTMSLPLFESTLDSERYFGTIVADPSIDSDLPVFHTFVNGSSLSIVNNDAGVRGAIYYDGELYDNVQIDLHGQSTRGFPKKSFDVDFTKDHRFRLNDDIPRMKDFNLLSNYADKAKLRNTLSYEAYRLAGSDYHLAFPVRIQSNGQFHAVYDFVEDGDDRWLERMGRDPEGALYKMYNTFNGTGEKKTRKEEGQQDLLDFQAGLNQSGQALTNFVYDNVNLPAMATYLAGFAYTSGRDCCHKNYYAYRDTNGTGEWWFMPWDVDLSMGRNWGGFGLGYHDYTIYADNPLFTGGNNALISRLYNNVTGFREMYLRRVRTLAEELYGMPGQPYQDRLLEGIVDGYVAQMSGDAEADHAKWGQVSSGREQQPFETWDEAVNKLKNLYLEPRRQFFFGESGEAGETLISGDVGVNDAKYLVPTNNSVDGVWMNEGFDDSGWSDGTYGFGYETSGSNYRSLITTDVEAEMSGQQSSLYSRIEFDVTDPGALTHLTLKMKYDDGFVAYINGVNVAQSSNVTSTNFNSTAGNRSDTLAVAFESHPITLADHPGLLNAGTNVLAIHGLNQATGSSDFLLVPQLVTGLDVQAVADLPPAQPDDVVIEFGAIEFNPASGNQDEEYIELVNNNSIAVDISGWTLEGGVEFEFVSGTVIPAGGTLYVSPDVNAFRARGSGPSGGQGLFVQGGYDGHLSNFGEQLVLMNKNGLQSNETTYVGDPSDPQEHLRITEINYDPAEPTAEELLVNPGFGNGDFEFIEFMNTSGAELALDDVKFTVGIGFDFEVGTTLAAGERAVLAKNLPAFEARYGTDVNVLGTYTGSLDNGGEVLKLEDASNSTIQEFEYDNNNGWPGRANGTGSSLEVIDTSGDYDSSSNYRSSSEYNGTPGTAGFGPRNDVVVNEVLAHTDLPLVDFIELFNTTGEAIDISGWVLSDSNNQFDKFVIPNGTVIAAGGYLTFDESDFNSGLSNVDFALNSAEGDDVWLLETDAQGDFTFFVDHAEFGATNNGESVGRFPNGSGDLVPLQFLTENAENAPPRVGPIVISEILYDPFEPTSGELLIDPNLDADDFEYVEIYNPTGATVSLDEWQLDDGVDFTFDALESDTNLAPGEAVVVVTFDPNDVENADRLNAFRSRYGIDGSVRLFGGWSGRLNNAGESVDLRDTDTPDVGPPPITPAPLEDRVDYDDLAPWPVIADGSGDSIHRVSATGFGSDPLNWTGGLPTPGSVNFVVGENVDVHLVPRLTPTTVSESLTLPVTDHPDGLGGFFGREGTPIVLEVWVSSAEVAEAVESGSITVHFDAAYGVPTLVDHGDVFNEPGTTFDSINLNGANSTVVFGGESSISDAGNGGFALLGRVTMMTNADIDLGTGDFGPYDLSVGLSAGSASFVLENSGNATIDAQPVSEVEVRSMIYDADNNGVVNFAELGFFLPAIGGTVGGSQPPFTNWADLNNDGSVDEDDQDLLLNAFGKGITDPTIVIPANARSEGGFGGGGGVDLLLLTDGESEDDEAEGEDGSAALEFAGGSTEGVNLLEVAGGVEL